MRTNSPSLMLYFTASFFAVLGVALKNNWLALLMKPIIIPAIFFYYLQIKKDKINWLFVLILVSNFISDMIVLFELPNGNIPIALLNMLSYLMFLYLSVKEISVKNFKNIRFFYFLLIFISLLVVLYMILDLMTGVDRFSNNLYVIYGILLTILASIIGFNHINNQSYKTLYALIMCICFITSDIFFVMYNFYLKMDVFIIFNVMSQFAAYYYMVKYITSKPVFVEE